MYLGDCLRLEQIINVFFFIFERYAQIPMKVQSAVLKKNFARSFFDKHNQLEVVINRDETKLN